MESVRRKRMNPDVVLQRTVVISSLVCLIVNGSILVISCASGQWVFGYAMCQIYGLLSQVLVAGSAWMVTLFALERGYRVLLPAEYVYTFSEINVRILIYSTYMLLLVMYTAPLYGWGEYSNYRGSIHLRMDVIPGNETSCVNNTNYDAIFNNASVATSLVLRTSYSSEIRYRLQEKILITRFPSRTHFHIFSMEFSSGAFERKVQDVFSDSLDWCNETGENIFIQFELPSKVLKVYTDIHIPFQEIGICALDFSPVNSNISTWIPFSVLTATGIPFVIAIILGLILHRFPRELGDRYPYAPQAIVIGSVAGLVSTIPYYIVNIYNNKEIFVSHSTNVASTLFYFSCSLWYVISTLVFKCVQRHICTARGQKLSSAVSLESLSCHSRIVT